MNAALLVWMTLAGSLTNVSPSDTANDPALAQQGYALLKKYCHRCHGAEFEAVGLNVLDRQNLLADRGPGKTPWVKAGNPSESRLWERLGVQRDMPPEGSAQPTEAERLLLGQWITAGAPFPQRVDRSFIEEGEVLKTIRDHLQNIPREERKFHRYFSMHSLFNNRKQVTTDELRQCRAGLSKLVNSLSWRSGIVVPVAIDSQETLYHIDIRDYGWDKKDLWSDLLKAYPYGMKQTAHHDDEVRRLAEEVEALAGDESPYVRADWFIATASRPPLYHTMLELPDNVDDLRTRLNVQTVSDFKDNQLARGGMLTSNVSTQNRMLDRHHSIYGYYWESYDFKTNEGSGNILQNPLGPKFDGHPFTFNAFQHDGGEIIFTLPNGLQGYFLIDANGKRIDAGPLEIVSDSLKTAGTPVIVNGLSCMACHSKGVVRFKDTLRDSITLSGAARAKVQQLFPKQSDWDKMLDKDEQRFLKSLQAATGQFLQVEDDKEKPISEFAEPIGGIARWYIRDLGPEAVASELNIANAADVPAMVRGNLRLRKLGLGPLSQGGTIKREQWSQIKENVSLYFEVARELELGEPIIAKAAAPLPAIKAAATAVASIAKTPAKAADKVADKAADKTAAKTPVKANTVVVVKAKK